MKLLTVFGTRPEVIKMAPVIKEIGKHRDEISCLNCVSAQHREMIDPLLRLFLVKVDYDLDIMCENQDLDHIATTVIGRLGSILEREDPDYLLVQGDTTTAMAASLAAYHRRIKVAHIEAGLRTGDKWRPFPEEMNRRLIDGLSDVLFAPTEGAKRNLISEGIGERSIVVTGNTVIDSLLDIAGREIGLSGTPLERVPWKDARIILVTAHRRESFGQPLAGICEAIREIAKQRSDVFVVFPVHLNPNVAETAHSILSGIDNVLLTEPLSYELFVQLMKGSHIIVTDSGGLQEEAPSLGKPVLVLREVSERPEAVEVGAARVIGLDPSRIIGEVVILLDDDEYSRRTSYGRNPFGDGRASQRIMEYFLDHVEN